MLHEVIGSWHTYTIPKKRQSTFGLLSPREAVTRTYVAKIMKRNSTIARSRGVSESDLESFKLHSIVHQGLAQRVATLNIYSSLIMRSKLSRCDW